ncbi:MAG: ribonuclease D [Anaerolineales bacterium]|nr:MAG: ribonuclease D [Anaerolineales bacterium]
MLETDLKRPTLIQDEAALRKLLARLRKEAVIAVDTESNSLHAYREQVCLIQVSIPGTDYLVDPLSLRDLGTLGQIFADPDIVKVLHGAEYDVLCLGRDFKYRLVNLFDTRMASRTLGWKKSGLGDLLDQIFDVKADKRFQRANWGKRPLSDELLDYACLDTHYLLAMRTHLLEELEKYKLTEQVLELCDWMALVAPTENGFDPEAFWRISHARELSRRQAAILRELYLMRDQLAREENRPPFKILSDTLLLSIAKHIPQTELQLRSPIGMTQRQIDRFARSTLSAVQRGQSAPLPHKPRGNHRDEDMVGRYDALREWRKGIARRRKVESDIILPRDLMESLARLAPNDSNSLRALMQPLAWRFQTYGSEILNVLGKYDSRGGS